ncbi:MAG: adenylate kinase family protein [Sulfolobales archaeon]
MGSLSRCRAIAISGTPGVGKTTVAKILADILGAKTIDLSQLVIEEGLYIEYDYERNSYIIDEDRVQKRLKELISQCNEEKESRYIIIEGHYAEIVDDQDLEILVILRTDPRELLKRLCSRGWGKEKSMENSEAEYLGICLANALNEHPPEKICELDVTGKEPSTVVKEILEILEGKARCERGIDWTTSIDPEELYRVAHIYCN